MMTRLLIFFVFTALGFFGWKISTHQGEYLAPEKTALAIPSTEAIPKVDLSEQFVEPLPEIPSVIQDLPPDLLARASEDLRMFVPEILKMHGGEFLESNLASLVMKRVLSEDPQTAFEHLPSVGSMDYERYVQCLFEVWIDLDRTAALKAARSLPRGGEIVIDILHSEEPELAFSLMKDLEKWPFSSRVFKSWTAKDPDAAYTALSSLGNDPVFEGALIGFASSLGSTDPHKALELTSSLSGERQRTALTHIYYAWFENDFIEPIRSLEAIENSTLKNYLIVSSIGPIAQGNPRSAWRLIQENLRGEDFEVAMSYIVGHDYYQEHGEMISQIVTQFEPGRIRDSLVTTVARKWGEIDPTATLAWLSRMGELPPEIKEISQQLAETKGDGESSVIDWTPFLETFKGVGE